MGVAQLEQIDMILKKKKSIHQTYKSLLDNVQNFYLAEVPSYASNNYWLNILRLNINEARFNANEIYELLRKENIETRPVWMLNHIQKPFKKFQSYHIENAQLLIKSSLCLPSSINITNDNIKEIVKYING